MKTTLGPIVINSPKSDIGIRVGRRVWAPLWPWQDGSPVPDQPLSDESPAYQHLRELHADRGFTLNWQTTYNAAANPISIRLHAPVKTEWCRC